MISAVIAGCYLNDYHFYESVKTTEFASKCIAYCEKNASASLLLYGLCFEEYLWELGVDES